MVANVNNIIGIFLCATLLFFTGCSSEEESWTRKGPGVYIGEGDKTIASMGETDVIVVINGKKIRKIDYLRCQHLQREIFKLVNFREGELARKAEAFVKANEQRVLPMLMQAEFFVQAAKKAGITVTHEEIEEMRKTLFSAYGIKAKSFDDVKKQLDSTASDCLYETVVNEAISKQTVRKLARPGWFVISPQELTNQLNYVSNFNNTADTMNKRARETLLKAKAEILSGKLFADVAKKYAEVHPEYGKEWITVELEELSAEGEAAMRKWLENANMGDISDPVDLDDGIAIIGVARKGPGEAPPGETPPVLYTLVRCTMFARQNMEVPSEGEAIELIRNTKIGYARQEVGTNLHNKAVIEFPNGTNFFNSVVDQRRGMNRD